MLEDEFTSKIDGDITAGGPGICAFMPRGVPHAWKDTGSETGRVLFLCTPPRPAILSRHWRNTGRALTNDELKQLSERHRWEGVGPNPL